MKKEKHLVSNSRFTLGPSWSRTEFGKKNNTLKSKLGSVNRYARCPFCKWRVPFQDRQAHIRTHAIFKAQAGGLRPLTKVAEGMWQKAKDKQAMRRRTPNEKPHRSVDLLDIALRGGAFDMNRRRH